MAGPVPAIHIFPPEESKAWMAGSRPVGSPAMTVGELSKAPWEVQVPADSLQKQEKSGAEGGPKPDQKDPLCL
jgi:hypothetical protein